MINYENLQPSAAAVAEIRSPDETAVLLSSITGLGATHMPSTAAGGAVFVLSPAALRLGVFPLPLLF